MDNLAEKVSTKSRSLLVFAYNGGEKSCVRCAEFYWTVKTSVKVQALAVIRITKKKFLGEFCRTITVGRCELRRCESYSRF